MIREIIYIIRTCIKFLNRRNIFFDIRKNDKPTLIIAGYTRSGTTYLASLLSGILKARCVHEPLHPEFSERVGFFHERESKRVIQGNERYLAALESVFHANYRGRRRDMGPCIFYNGKRIIKLVRANFYLDLISDILTNVPIVFLVRNPLACIASRIKKEWLVPDHSHCISDILPLLNKEQIGLIKNEKAHHKRMAISWCLDNYMVFTNHANKGFRFLYYEHIVGSYTETESILKFINIHIPENRIKKEIDFYRRNAPQKTIFSRDTFEKRLGKKEVHDIMGIISIFSFGNLYDYDTGKPKNLRS